MKRIYDISKGQIITVWLFGIIAWLWALDDASSWDSSGLGSFLSILIPFLLIFYTIGWRKEKKSDSLLNTIKSIFSFLKKIIKAYYGFLILVICIIFGLFILNNSDNDIPNNISSNTQEDGIDIKSVNNTQELTDRPLIETVSFATDKVYSGDNSLDFYMSDFINLGSQVTNDFIYKTYSPSPITSGNYMKAVFYVDNLTKVSRKIKLVSVNLVDDQERVFNKNLVFHCGNPLEEFSSNDYFSFNSIIEIKPGIPCKFSALFETPKDMKGAYIKITYINN
jgi:hypothetical protein